MAEVAAEGLNAAAGRVEGGQESGNDLVSEYTVYQSELLDDTGESLGKIIGTQINMIESDRKFQVGVAFPKKVSNAAQAEAGEIKKKAS
jgi:hypothetical protein